MLERILQIKYNNSTCEYLLVADCESLNKQLNDDMILYIYEDGQISEWLDFYKKSNTKIEQCVENKGVAYARNKALDYLVDKVNYILFIDSDDIVENNYLEVIYKYCLDGIYEIVESTFYVNGTQAGFNPNAVRTGVAGSALKTSIIGNIRFNEKLQIAEDTTFMNAVIDLSKYRKIHAPTIYIYQYGINDNSLIMKYNRKEIKEER